MSTWPLSAARVVIAAMAVAAACAFGCSSGDSGGSLGATFTASATPQAPGLVKLVQKSKSNTRVVVQAVIYGPDVTLDMYSFAFDVKIGDPSVVRYVAGSAVAGAGADAALVPFAGQTIQAIADLGTAPGGGVDNSRVVVGVTKLGGGVGNGIADTSAVVVELTFAVQKEGTTTLTLTGNPTPAVLDSNQPASVISSITFDSASATVKGVSTGGGGY